MSGFKLYIGVTGNSNHAALSQRSLCAECVAIFAKSLDDNEISGFFLHSSRMRQPYFIHMTYDYIDGTDLSHPMTKPTNWPVRTAKTQISLGIRTV